MGAYLNQYEKKYSGPEAKQQMVEDNKGIERELENVGDCLDSRPVVRCSPELGLHSRVRYRLERHNPGVITTIIDDYGNSRLLLEVKQFISEGWIARQVDNLAQKYGFNPVEKKKE